jgi:hypothetical protein
LSNIQCKINNIKYKIKTYFKKNPAHEAANQNPSSQSGGSGLVFQKDFTKERL